MVLIEMFGLIPVLAPVAAPVGFWLRLIAIWSGAAAAHNAKGWRSIILPILGVLFAVLLPLLVQAMVSGAIFSLESLWLWLHALDW